MKVYVFGNEDVAGDNIAPKVAKKLKGAIKGLEFEFIKANADLPFEDGAGMVIMDGVEGIRKTTLFSEKDFERFVLPPRATTHDFDLGFQLKYLKKLGKLKKVLIIGLPKKGRIDYEVLQSILRKLVAQDIQGS